MLSSCFHRPSSLLTSTSGRNSLIQPCACTGHSVAVRALHTPRQTAMMPPCSSVGVAPREGRFLHPELVCACLASDLISMRNENPAGELLCRRILAWGGWGGRVHSVARSVSMKPTDQTSQGIRLALPPSSTSK